MKKVTSLILTFIMVIGIVIIPVTANAATTSFNLVIGQTYGGTIEEGSWLSQNSHEYTFTTDKSANVAIAVYSENTSMTWSLASTDYSVYISTQKVPMAGLCYLPKGKTYKLSVSGAGQYALQLKMSDPDKISMKGKSCKLSTTNPKKVQFKFTGTKDYAKDNLSIKNSTKKVADASFTIDSNNAGTLKIKPKYIGKTVITLKMAGSNSVKYTVHGVHGYWFIAKGDKVKAPKPAGVKKPKWKTSKKSVCTVNKKTGKVKAKKGGKVTITAKKGKVSYKLTTVITDYIKLGKKTYKKIKEQVNNPDKLKIYNVYSGYSKQVDTSRKIPVLVVDYGSTNENGAMVRSKIMAFYDEVMEPHFTNGWSIDNIISRKSISPSKIK